ncbi:ribosomal protein P0 (A0) (L10E) [Glugoides intestinalis]
MSACTATEHKTLMYNKTKELFSTHKNYMLLSINRVKATQLKDVKSLISQKVKILVAKKKIMKKALQDLDADKYKDLSEMLRGDVIVAFFDGVDPKEIFDVSKGNMRRTAAVSGDIAPNDVFIPAGPTGLEPEKIKLFQAANIATKINKGKIDLVADHKLLSSGDSVSISNAKLLKMLNILPFEFGLDIIKVFENNESYGKELLDITEEVVSESIKDAVCLLAAVSLGSNTTTEVSVPFELKNAFADIAKLSLATGFNIQEFKN